MAIFQQGMFTNSAATTPDEIARKRAMIAALMPRFGSAKYVGEGLGQLATGFAIGRQNKKLDASEAAGRKSAEDMFATLFSGQGGASGGSGGGYTPSGTWTPAAPVPDALEVAQGTMQGGNSFPNQPKADLGGVSGMGNAGLSFGSATMTPQEMLIAGAEKRGLNPIDVATAISYETGGTFDPMIKGPTTQYGQHEGLIQFGEPQAAQYGADFSDPKAAMRSQLDPTSGAVWNYLDQTGVKSGMGLPEIYSAINAGAVGRMGASDANNGGAPGTVADKVAGMGDHREKAAAFLGGTWTPNADVTSSAMGQPSGGGQPSSMPSMNELYTALQNPWLSADQKSLIVGMIGQQQQASDPMHQIELEKAQLELAQMKDPGTQAPEDYTNRMFTLSALGIDPQSEEGKSYILTGKMPEAPEAGYATVSPDEVARLGLPPGVYQRGPDGKIETVEKTPPVASETDGRYQPVGGLIWDMKPDGGGPPVIVGGGSEEVIYGPDGNPILTRGPAGTGKALTEGQSKDVVYATRAEGALATLEPIAGSLTSRADIAKGWVPFGLGADYQDPNYQVAKTAGDEFLQAILRKDTGAAITPDEQSLYGKTYLPQPGDGPEVLAYKVEARKRAVDALKGGMTPSAIIAQERALAGTVQPDGGAAPEASSAASAEGAPASITSDAEYDALPSGTVFIGPDGIKRRKP